jgi:hypothetical protein
MIAWPLKSKPIARGHLPGAAAAEAEHVRHNLRRPGASLLNAIEQLRDFAHLQVLVDCFQLDADVLGLLQVFGQVR